MEELDIAVQNYINDIEVKINFLRVFNAPDFENIEYNFGDGDNFGDAVIPAIEPDCTYVYIVRLEQITAEQIAAAREQYRAEDGNCRLPLWRGDAPNRYDETGVLYIGQCRNLQRRLTQHLTNHNPITYALHLAAWIGNQAFMISIQYASTPRNISQHVENALWDHYLPLFGKRGPR